MKKSSPFKQLIWMVIILVFFGYLSYYSVFAFRKSLSWHTYVVQSGSMEPSIMTGDVVLIKKQPDYIRNDVITFKDENNRTITHRLLEVEEVNGKKLFSTKGDANQTADPEKIEAGSIVGKVVLTVPKFGYLIQFIKSPWGFILCIIVPSVLILYDEARNIMTELRRKR